MSLRLLLKFRKYQGVKITVISFSQKDRSTLKGLPFDFLWILRYMYLGQIGVGLMLWYMYLEEDVTNESKKQNTSAY